MLRLQVHEHFPQPRSIQQAVQILKGGGLAIYPTGSTYGVGCDLFARRTVGRIYELRGFDQTHQLSFLCADLSQVSQYAVVEDRNFRLLRHHLPGQFTFILPATRDVPKIMQSNKRTVGVRIPSHPTCAALLRDLGHPIVSATLALSSDEQGETTFVRDADVIMRQYARTVDVFLDVGYLTGEPTTVVDLTGELPAIVRVGAGDTAWIESTLK